MAAKSFCLCLTLLLSLPALSLPARADDDPPKRTLSLSATGTVKAAPDTADITAGVESDAPTAKDALAKNSAAMSKVIDGLKEDGIAPSDIQTTDFSISPTYAERNDNRTQRLTGYHVSNQVHVVLHDVAKLGDVLDKAVSLGANSIDGISFSVANEDALMDEARKQAMAKALARAKLYANAAGAELGPVVSISEEGGYAPVYARAAPMAAGMKATPVEAGTSSIEIRVQVTWELD